MYSAVSGMKLAERRSNLLITDLFYGICAEGINM
jgi:hypothetical protein